jgi:hypothetical protein
MMALARSSRKVGSWSHAARESENEWSRIPALLVLIGDGECCHPFFELRMTLLMGVFPRRNAAETAKAFTPWRTILANASAGK